MADGRQIAAVFVGGAVGSLARAAFSAAFPWSQGQWPWPTFIVNVAGCAILGYCTTRLQEQLPVSAYRRPLLGTGLCGGLTTFSTMQLEILKMLDAGERSLALGYAASIIVTGFAAVHMTTVTVRRLWVGLGTPL